MPRIMKVNNMKIHCFTPHEADRIPNIGIGQHCRIHTNHILLCNPKLNRIINDDTMSALDNYAQHEKMDIYITPLENDLFNDLKVSVFKKGNEDKVFPMNSPKTEKGTPDFLRKLYTEIHKSIHPTDTLKTTPKTEKSLWKDLKNYIDNISDRFNNYRMGKIRSFIEKHEDSNGIGRLMADALEETYFNKLY